MQIEVRLDKIQSYYAHDIAVSLGNIAITVAVHLVQWYLQK